MVGPTINLISGTMYRVRSKWENTVCVCVYRVKARWENTGQGNQAKPVLVLSRLIPSLGRRKLAWSGKGNAFFGSIVLGNF